MKRRRSGIARRQPASHRRPGLPAPRRARSRRTLRSGRCADSSDWPGCRRQINRQARDPKRGDDPAQLDVAQVEVGAHQPQRWQAAPCSRAVPWLTRHRRPCLRVAEEGLVGRAGGVQTLLGDATGVMAATGEGEGVLGWPGEGDASGEGAGCGAGEGGGTVVSVGSGVATGTAVGDGSAVADTCTTGEGDVTAGIAVNVGGRATRAAWLAPGSASAQAADAC